MWIKNNSILLSHGRAYTRTSSFIGLSTGCDFSNSNESSSAFCEPQSNVCPCELAVRWYAEDHNGCVEYRTNSSTYQFESVPNSYDVNRTIDGHSCYCRSITNMCTPGTFDIQFRWVSGHSPYPSISKMTIVVFGVKVRNNEKMPCACDTDPSKRDYETVARVTINEDKTWFVEKIGGESSGNSNSISSIEEDDVQ